MTLLKIRLRLVSIDLIYFNSSYSLEVKHSIQGESSFLDIYLSFVKIKLILYFYITLHIEPEDPVECKCSRFHSSLQVEEYFCFTRYLIYFNSLYSLVKHYIQGESRFLNIYLSFIKIKLILHFYVTLHIETEDPVECKYSRFHSLYK